MRSNRYITTLLLGTLSLASLPTQAAYHSLEEIRQTAAQYAAKRLNAGADSLVEANHLDPRLKLQQCPTPLSAQPLGNRISGGNMTVVIKCRGEQPWSVYVPVKVMSYVKVAVAKHPLAAGIPIRRDDIVLEKRDVSRLSSGYFKDLGEVLNRPPKRTLTKGAIVSPKDLGINKIINKGNRVSIVAETGGITVRMPGMALTEAGKGESIQVRNLSSSRTVDAIVLGPGLVKVPM